MKKIIGCSVVVLSLAACSSDGGSNDGTQGGRLSAVNSEKPEASATDDTKPPAKKETGEACVTKATKANDKGVGAYCDKTTKCTGTTFCTGDVGAPEDATFCTILCKEDTECGEGAKCFHEGRGSACVPTRCHE